MELSIWLLTPQFMVIVPHEEHVVPEQEQGLLILIRLAKNKTDKKILHLNFISLKPIQAVNSLKYTFAIIKN